MFLLALAAATTHTITNGQGAIATFSASDGCVVTTGEIVVLESNAGHDKEGVIVVATQIDTCDPTDFGTGYFGLGDIGFDTSGLSSAYADGVFVLDGTDGSQLTVDVDLDWTGTGTVSHQVSRFKSENTFDFQAGESRNATLSGSLVVGGYAATIDSALLIRGVGGSIMR